MKFELNDYHRGMTDDTLLDDLKLVAKKLDKNSVTEEEYGIHGRYHTTTIFRRFGSWFAAIERAGLDSSRTPMNVLDDDLFHNLEEVWIKLGRQPSYNDVEKPLSKYHVTTYAKRFGGWRNALEEFVKYVNDDDEVRQSEQITPSIVTINKHKTKRNINWRLRFIIMRRDNFKCQSCGRSPATDPSIILHIDHKKAWANGGETILENLQTLCSVCNIGKSDIE
jgi:hypothetical protein